MAAAPPQQNQVKVFDWLTAYLKGVLGYVFGQNGEKGIDIGVPVGTPVGNLVSGKVVAIDSTNANNSIGYVVQVHGDNHQLWHYQHLSSLRPGLAVGQNVGLGDVIGYSGGCASYLQDGSGCSTTDQWSTGPHIEVRESQTWDPNQGVWNQAWVDPRPDLNKWAPQIVGNPNWNVPATNALNHDVNYKGVPAPCNDLIAQYYVRAANGNPVGNAADFAGTSLQFAVCQLQQSVAGWGIKIGLFALALTLVVFGGILLIHPNVEQGAGTLAKAAVLA